MQQSNLPKRVIESYLYTFGYRWWGKRQRAKKEKKLFAQGYRVVEEEVYTPPFQIGAFNASKKLRVTYERPE